MSSTTKWVRTTKMSKKRWDVKNSSIVSDIKKVARKTGEALGLYPEEEQQKASQCGVDGCEITESHRHPTVISSPEDRRKATQQSNFEAVKSRVTAPVAGALDDHIQSAQANAPASLGLDRVSHFQAGASEHLPKNVVSMKDFKAKQMSRKGRGY